MGLLEKAANTIYHQQGWFTSESFKNAPVGSWSNNDGHIFESRGDLKSGNMGVPDPDTSTVTRVPHWFTDSSVTVGTWTSKGGVPGGLASLSVKLEFDSQFSIACFLQDYTEVQMKYLDTVGDALV